MAVMVGWFWYLRVAEEMGYSPLQIRVIDQITKIFIGDICYFIVIRNNAVIFYQSYPFKVICFVREKWFYSFPERFVIYNAFGIEIWKVTFCFLNSLTHIFLWLYCYMLFCLLQTYFSEIYSLILT